MISCDIYKGSKKAEMYLYVPSDKGLAEVPEPLIESFGELALVITLPLTESRTLARVDVAKVIEALQQQGYYLQMPPSSWTDSAGITEDSA